MSFEFDDDDEEVARARLDRLAALLDVVRANTKEVNEIAAEIREDTSRRTEYMRLLRAYREQGEGTASVESLETTYALSGTLDSSAGRAHAAPPCSLGATRSRSLRRSAPSPKTPGTRRHAKGDTR